MSVLVAIFAKCSRICSNCWGKYKFSNIDLRLMEKREKAIDEKYCVCCGNALNEN